MLECLQYAAEVACSEQVDIWFTLLRRYHFESPTSPSSDGDMSAVPRWGLSRIAFDLLDNAKVITDVGAMSFVSLSTRLPVSGNH